MTEGVRGFPDRYSAIMMQCKEEGRHMRTEDGYMGSACTKKGM